MTKTQYEELVYSNIPLMQNVSMNMVEIFDYVAKWIVINGIPYEHELVKETRYQLIMLQINGYWKFDDVSSKIEGLRSLP